MIDAAVPGSGEAWDYGSVRDKGLEGRPWLLAGRPGCPQRRPGCRAGRCLGRGCLLRRRIVPRGQGPGQDQGLRDGGQIAVRASDRKAGAGAETWPAGAESQRRKAAAGERLLGRRSLFSESLTLFQPEPRALPLTSRFSYEVLMTTSSMYSSPIWRLCSAPSWTLLRLVPVMLTALLEYFCTPSNHTWIVVLLPLAVTRIVT